MRKSYLPITVLGLGGLGLVGMLLGTEKGRAVVRNIADNLFDGPETFEDWNMAAQNELEAIQSALDGLAQALGVRPAAQ
ncbi:MAG: hypothetical protein JWO13_1980 [Acidobacteriales bacterium]|nr:hypothetical protein [Terriglobales bacterium]